MSPRPIPFVAQVELADCGAACVAMVLAHHGAPRRLDDVRRAIGSGRDGVDALALLRGAEALGLRGRGVRLEAEALRELPTGAILHWEFNHFVVFEKVTRTGAVIVDPAYGRREVPLARVRRSFTGVALILEPAAPLAASPDRRRPFARYVRMVADQRRLLGRALSTSIMLRALALALPLVTGLVVDRLVPRGDRALLPIIAIGLGLVLVLQVLASLVRAHGLLELRSRVDARLSVGFLEHLLALPYDFFQRRSTGDLMLRVAGNTAIRERLTTALLAALLDGPLVIVYAALALWRAPALAAIALGLGGLQVALYLLSRRRIRELTAADLESQARAQSYLAQLLAGVESLKVAGAERRAVHRWADLYAAELNVAIARGRLDALLGSLRGALTTGGPLALLVAGAAMVLDGQLSLGTMLAVNGLAIGFLTPLDALVDAALAVASLHGYVARLDDVLATDVEQPEARSDAPRLRGTIALRNVSFRYGPTAPPVLRRVDLEIPAGAMVAIVGRSGSGKSTLARLLLGLYQPTEGRVLFDETDLASLDVRGVRRQLGVVPQAPHIFAGSVRDNIALGAPGVSHDRVVAAARRAGIDGEIQQLAMGYDTPMADGGATLSGGQRQRLALARALVGQPAVLLLDEATSSLDAITEREVMTNLAELACTRVVIAHRLSTIAAADLIVVLEDGAVVGTGTHGELLARAGAYAALVNHQARLAREELS